MFGSQFARTRPSTLAVLLLAATAAPAIAQPYEFAYGPAGTSDRGMRGTTAVNVCPGGGSVSVGTSGSGATARVYVVRTNGAGGPIWERFYDLSPVTGFVAGFESGESITELKDGSGFVVAGTTRPASTAPRDAFLLKINCSGWWTWAQAYHSPADEGALNVVEARTGDPAWGTAPGDLIVSGFAPDPAAP